MLLVDDPLGAVPVKQIDGQEKRLPQKRERSVSLDEEVDEVRPHEPLDLALHVDEVGIGQSLVLLRHSWSVCSSLC